MAYLGSFTARPARSVPGRDHLATRILLLGLVATVVPAVGWAQTEATDTLGKQAAAVRVAGDVIRLDGRLDEESWATAPALTDFVQKEPVEGAPPTDRMEVRFVYDDDALYIGARMFSESRSAVQAPLSRRDDVQQAEYVLVSFDTFLDRRTAYTFGVTASGVRLDHFHPEDDENRQDQEFEPVWEARTEISDRGWTAELWIPFSQLRFNNQSEQVWGLNIQRWIPSRNEEVYWVLIPRTVQGWASRFGDLRGIRDVPPTRRVELLPYAGSSSRVSGDSSPSNPFDTAANLSGRAGADLKMGLGPNLTLEATVNPDFGQVEADPAEVNLSAFETFFGERRPFFVEGSRLLNSQVVVNYYYSRRIGAPPTAPVHGDFIDYPRESTILGAAKLSGRLASGTSLGFLGAVTGEEFARVANQTAPDLTVRSRVAPRTVWGVARVQQEFGSATSTAGVMVTAIHRDLDESDPLALRLTRNAYTVSGDSVLRFREGEYEVRLQGGASYADGNPEAILRLQRSPVRYLQRPDAGYVTLDPNRRRLIGGKGGAEVERTSGRHWLWSSRLDFESPEFEVNDIGRLSLADGIQSSNNLRYRETQPGRVFRSYSVGLNNRAEWNYGGDRQTREYGLNGSATWLNFWSTRVSLNLERRAQDLALTRGGPSMQEPNGWQLNARVGNSSAARNRWNASVAYGRDEDGGLEFDAGVSLSVRPQSRWELSVGPSYERSLDTQQYVTELDRTGPETFGRRYVFAHIDRSTIVMQTRLNYTFKPDLTLDVYAEPFAASGDFFNHSELAVPRTRIVRQYGTDGTTADLLADGTLRVADGQDSFDLTNRDFNVVSFRSNAVLRWEWKPGSTLFVVWQQDRFERTLTDARVAGRDLFGSLRSPGVNSFLVKASFWLPLG